MHFSKHRPMPFAFEKEIGKSVKLVRRGIQRLFSVKKLLPCPCRRRDMQGRIPEHSFPGHPREPVFLSCGKVTARDQVLAGLGFITSQFCNCSTILAFIFAFKSWSQNYSSNRTWLKAKFFLSCSYILFHLTSL